MSEAPTPASEGSKPAMDAGRLSTLPDSALLERYVSHQDEAAFAAILARHGPMVLGLCRRLLRDQHQADDAFQAAFLILIKKAASIRKQDSVASWLYGVACKVASKARLRLDRRRNVENESATMKPQEASDELPDDDLRPLLDEEVGQLPEKFRLPVVLCYLEGKTNEEAAELLHWPTGTVKGRLSQARDMLKKRLLRRGITLTSAGLLAILEQPASAAVPAELTTALTQAATNLAAGAPAGAQISAEATSLSQSVLDSIWWTKAWLSSAAAILIVVTGVGLGLMLRDPTLPTLPLPIDPPLPSEKPYQWKLYEPKDEAGKQWARAGIVPAYTKSLPAVPDTTPLVALSFREKDQRFGIHVTGQEDPRNPQERKRLTFALDGSTNNTCVKIDGFENLFGRAPGQWQHDAHGPIKERKIIVGRQWASAWRYPQGVIVTQTVKIVPNDFTGQLDTVLVHYLVENQDKQRTHTVGLRTMIDSFIGSNDGVPFVIPGRPGFVDEKIDLDRSAELPDFIQAVEKPDLAAPGTVVQVGLKLPAGFRLDKGDPALEPITRLLICRYPGNPDAGWDFTKEGRFWAMTDRARGPDDDSCVTLYWDDRPLKPKEKRACAFTYGLGKISRDGDKPGITQLALTYGGLPMAGGEFTVGAWLKNVADGQPVRIYLPDGLQLIKPEEAEQRVHPNIKGLTQASWRVRVADDASPGTYRLTVIAGDVGEKLDVHVRDFAIATIDTSY